MHGSLYISNGVVSKVMLNLAYHDIVSSWLSSKLTSQ